MTFKHIFSIWAALLIGVNVSACKASQDQTSDSRSLNLSTPGPNLTPTDKDMATASVATDSDFESEAKTAAAELIKRLGAQEAFAMLGWQVNPDYEPMDHCFDYWSEVEEVVLEIEKVRNCERHVNDLSRLYASYGVDANPIVFKSKYYWGQKREFYPIWQNLVKAWETQGGSEDNEVFLKHPVCAKPLQEGWTGSDYFYDGREHPLCRFYKIEAIESRALD